MRRRNRCVGEDCRANSTLRIVANLFFKSSNRGSAVGSMPMRTMLFTVASSTAAIEVCRTIDRRTSGVRKCSAKLCDLIVGNVSSIATLAMHASARMIAAAVFIIAVRDVRISTDSQSSSRATIRNNLTRRSTAGGNARPYGFASGSQSKYPTPHLLPACSPMSKSQGRIRTQSLTHDYVQVIVELTATVTGRLASGLVWLADPF